MSKESSATPAADVEAGQVSAVLREVGKVLQQASTRRDKSGQTFAEFKARHIKSKAKPSHAGR